MQKFSASEPVLTFNVFHPQGRYGKNFETWHDCKQNLSNFWNMFEFQCPALILPAIFPWTYVQSLLMQKTQNNYRDYLDRKTSGFLAKIKFTRIPWESSFFKKRIHKSNKLVYEKIIPSKLRLKNFNSFCKMAFAEKTAGTAKILFCCKIYLSQSANFFHYFARLLYYQSILCHSMCIGM